MAQDWAKDNLAKSPRHGEFVTINESNGRKLQAWVVYPEVKEKAPVVVMVHEIYGLSDWAREMADEIAGAGYIAVMPDLLSGLGPATAANVQRFPTNEYIQTPEAEKAPTAVHLAVMGCDPMDCAPGQKPTLQSASFPVQQAQDHSHMQAPSANGAPFVRVDPGGTSAFPPDQVTRAVSALPNDQVLADLDAAADYGKKLPAANGKLFVAGFCWGGGKSFLFATHRPDLSAAFVFYGPPPPPELMKNISAPVFGFYAGNDARITATVEPTRQAMKDAGRKFDPVVYDGAGHGFMRAGEAPNANAADTAARQAGFKRWVDLMGGVR